MVLDSNMFSELSALIIPKRSIYLDYNFFLNLDYNSRYTFKKKMRARAKKKPINIKQHIILCHVKTAMGTRKYTCEMGENVYS